MNKYFYKILFYALLLVIISVLGTIFINLYIINSTKSQIIKLDNIKNIKDIDAILVLGCKAYSDRPSLMLSKRLEKAIDIYESINAKLLLSGDHGKKDYDEVNAMRSFVLNLGVDSKDIFLDHAGFNTYDSIYRAKYIFRAEKIVIVTQKYHMYRALFLANQLDLEAIGIVADDIPQKAVMLKNEIREILSRDKNFFKGLLKPQSKYLGDIIPLNQDGTVTIG